MDRQIRLRSLEPNIARVNSSFYPGIGRPVRMYFIESNNPQIKRDEVLDMRFELFLPLLYKNFKLFCSTKGKRKKSNSINQLQQQQQQQHSYQQYQNGNYYTNANGHIVRVNAYNEEEVRRRISTGNVPMKREKLSTRSQNPSNAQNQWPPDNQNQFSSFMSSPKHDYTDHRYGNYFH